jgi:2-oxoglutarate dehydrogenase E2 component (dihydrolipoamide succinyltransferase)
MTDAAVIDIRVPDQEEGARAELRAWFKTRGDIVAEGEPLAEIETDKVAFEVTAPAGGRLSEILVAEGPVAPGAVIGRLAAAITTPGQALPRSPDAGTPPPPPRPAPRPVEAPSRPDKERGEGASSSLSPREERLSAAVRRLAKRHGIGPGGLAGSGAGGRVTLADVEREAARRDDAGRQTATDGTSRRIPHSPMRRAIAEHMALSVATAPHVTAVVEADFSTVMAHRRAREDAFARDGIALTLTAYVVLACAQAMKTAPTINSRWHEDALEVFDAVHVGIGTALGEEGLVAPVLRDVGRLSLRETAAGLHDLTSRARAGRLQPRDMQGGTFTISNHGVSGTLLAAPIIISQPQCAILGVGKVEKRVVVREIGGADALLIRPMAYVTLTIDHRAIDGAVANAWLQRFVEVLESWPASEG